jgi:tripeptide aminopeptidase
MDNNKLERLKEILSIPSYYGREEKVRQYIADWATNRNIPYYIDSVGNIYLTKGESDFYPCMVAHMDTVHKISYTGIDIVEETYVFSNKDTSSACSGKQVLRGYIGGKEHTINNRTGCGGDDKAGVFLALEIIDTFDVIKGAFFISEEIGCIGSSQADPKFFENVAYAIQHDSPENDTISWYCSGYLLFNDEWAKPTVVIGESGEERFDGKIGDLLYDYGVRDFARHPFTDVSQLKKNFDFQCINLPAAYYHYHTSNECVLIEGIETAFELSVKIIERLGNEKQEFAKQTNSYSYGYSGGQYSGYGYNRRNKKVLTPTQIRDKVMAHYQEKYGMSETDFAFIYDGLYYYIEDFAGEKTIEEISSEYNDEYPFYAN